jgi:hypothetical protein
MRKEPQPLDNYRNLSIVVTMLVSFTLGFVYLYWHAPPDWPKSGPQPLAVAAETAPAMPIMPRLASVSQPAPVPLGQVLARTMHTQQTEAPSPNDAPPSEMVPVLVTLLNPGEGSIRNQRDEELPVTISETNQHLGQVAQIQMVLGSSEKKKFTVNDGLPMQSSDRIIVHSSGFLDQESQIP